MGALRLSAGGARALSWTVLASLLALTVIGALVFERDGPLLVGESTALMQAESLAWDFDLRYERHDYERFTAARHGEAADLALSSAGGERIAYDRPFPYALWLAPFLRWGGVSGYALANALLLALAALLAARSLRQRLGAAAPLWVAALIFGSVSFGYVFLAGSDVFLMTLAVVACSLMSEPLGATGEEQVYGGSARASRWRWRLAGALLSVLLLQDPLLGVLVLVAWIVARGAGAGARSALVEGCLAAALLQLAVLWWSGAGLTFFATTRFRFTPATGFPLVDFTTAEWSQSVHRLKAFHWDGAPRLSWGLEPRLWLWNVLYLLVGRSIGLLPYFAPLVLLWLSSSAGRWRRALSLASLLWVLGLLVLHPFDLAGGEGAIANRRFLPLYGALWFLAQRARRGLWVGIALAMVPATLFLGSLWRAPWQALKATDSGYLYVTNAAESWLPFETSQRSLPSAGEEHLDHLWIRFVNAAAWHEQRRDRLMMDGEKSPELLIASSVPLVSLRLELGAEAPSSLEVEGAELRERVLLSNGGIAFQLRPTGMRPRHAMWWTPSPRHLYHVRFTLPGAGPGPLAWKLLGEPAGSS